MGFTNIFIILIHIFSEGKFGEKIRLYKNNETDQNVFLHTMRSSMDNRLIAAAQTVWDKKRTGAVSRPFVSNMFDYVKRLP